MFFILSKTLSFFLEPLVIPYLFLGIGAIARWRQRHRIMKLSFASAIALPLVYGILPVSSLPLQFLESRIVCG